MPAIPPITEPPLRGALFTVGQLELHARGLAAAHTLGPRRGGGRLQRRLADSERVIARCHDALSAAQAAGHRMSPAAEWLLDNHSLIEEQIDLARRHFPRGYSRHLPRLAGGDPPGLPRIYDLVVELITHVDGRVDDEALSRYIAAYQTVTPLCLGELWSVAIMLRLALVENLRRVALRIASQREHRDLALEWARRDRTDNALLALADMVRAGPPLSTAFVAQFTQALQGRGAATTYVIAWLEQRLAEEGQSLEDVVRAENRSQAADQASMARELGERLVFSRKSDPLLVSTSIFDEEAIRAELRQTLELARGCRVELIMKDVHTLDNHPERLPRWVELAREVVDEYYP